MKTSRISSDCAALLNISSSESGVWSAGCSPSAAEAASGPAAVRWPRTVAWARLRRQRSARRRRGRLGDDAVGEFAEPFGQVTADHVPQQRAQVLGDLAGELLALRSGVRLRRGAASARARSPPRSGGQLGDVLVGRAESRQAPGEQLRRRAPRPPAARSAPAGCRSAPRARRGARRPARSAPAPSRACRRRRRGARRGCRRRAAHPPGRGSAAASRALRRSAGKLQAPARRRRRY